MAISVYYEFSAPNSFAVSDVVRALEAARKNAISHHFGVVSALNRQVAGEQVVFCIENPLQTGAVLKVAPTSGFWFKIQLAHAANSALVGLCRFPATIKMAGREVSSGLGSGWHFQGSCRTQNPARSEFREFRKRHTGLIDLLHALEKSGITIEVEDDGGYWESNDDSRLEKKFTAELETTPVLDAVFANALEGRAPERTPTLFSVPLRGQFLAQFGKHSK